MITATTLDELPPTVPPVLAEALEKAKALHDKAEELGLWGRQPAFVFHYKMEGGELRIDFTDVADVTDAKQTAILDEQLRILIYDKRVKPTPGRHLGTAAFAESSTLIGDDAAALMQQLTSLTGKKLEYTIRKAERQGRLVWTRVTMGAFAGGWRFEYRTFRNRDDVEIEIVEPGEQADFNDTFRLVLRLDEKMATRG